MKFGFFVYLFGVCILVPITAQPSNGSKETCMKGPFRFEGESMWDLNNTMWSVDHTRWSLHNPFRGYNHYLALNFSQEKSVTFWSSVVTSPPLCSMGNGTHSLSFRYSIASILGSTICYLAVSHQTGDTVTPLWRSSGGTMNIFRKVSPPIEFPNCASEFKLRFEGVKVNSGKCGGIFNTITFDDVRYSFVQDNTGKQSICPGKKPTSKPHTGAKNMWTVGSIIALAVCLTVIVVLSAILISMVIVTRRKRPPEGLEKSCTHTYQTFSTFNSARSSDYEQMCEDDRMQTPTSTSGGNDPYSLLDRNAGGAAAMTQNYPQAHYDHCTYDGDTSYSLLHHQDRFREAQRQVTSKDYSHI